MVDMANLVDLLPFTFGDASLPVKVVELGVTVVMVTLVNKRNNRLYTSCSVPLAD